MNDETVKQLVKEALEARKNAYTPYSHFSVGAALLCADGQIVRGCNIESSTFTPTICAERTAFFKAVSEGKRDFKAIAVVGARDDVEKPNRFCPPCGVCRQVMTEFCDLKTFTIILSDGVNIEGRPLADFLPFAFDFDECKKD